MQGANAELSLRSYLRCTNVPTARFDKFEFMRLLWRSGVSLRARRWSRYALKTSTEKTSVKCNGSVTNQLLMAYLKTKNGAYKAGGYMVQGSGAVLIEEIVWR